MLKGWQRGISLPGALATAAVCLSFATPGLAADTSRQPSALDYAGVYSLRDAHPQLTGQGASITIVGRSMTYTNGLPMNDYRPFAGHDIFVGKTLSFHDSAAATAGVSLHETAVASILFGRDPNASFGSLGALRYEGVAPEAKADFYEFWNFLTKSVFPSVRPQADVVTISLGSQFEDWWTRGIDAMAEKYGLPIVAGIGNGTNAYDSALFPAAGSNVIGVGMVQEVHSESLISGLSHFWLPRPATSSCGPTDDNRSKPDIVAPGKFVVADSTNPAAFVVTPSCSSYATPLVAGVIGLLAQAAKSDPNLADATGTGSAPVMKAVLMTSARKLPWWHKGSINPEDDHAVPLDYSQGAGAVDALAAYTLLKSGEQKSGSVAASGWDLASLKLDGTAANSYAFDGQPGAGRTIAATLVWNRHYKQTYPFEHDKTRDADLALELWSYDAAGAKLADYSDSHTDNVEHISFAAEPNTSYFLVVRMSQAAVAENADEKYAIAWRQTSTQPRDAAWYDINGDGLMNAADAVAMIANFTHAGQPESAGVIGDFNGDGKVDLLDLLFLSRKVDNR
jgi:hypothetical protein